MKSSSTELAKIFDEIKLRMGWKQKRLAQELGTTQSTISKMRTGSGWNKHFAVIRKLLAIARDLGLE